MVQETWFPSLAIAAGYNNSIALAAIEAITPPGDKPFLTPRALGLYDPGAFRIRGDGTLYTAGYPTAQWLWSAISQAQVRYLMETYCNNGYSGKVTFSTRTDDPDVYTIYNAVLLLPKLSESDKRYKFFRNYTATFARLAAT